MISEAVSRLFPSSYRPFPLRGPFLTGRFGPLEVSKSPALMPAPPKSLQPTFLIRSARSFSALEFFVFFAKLDSTSLGSESGFRP